MTKNKKCPLILIIDDEFVIRETLSYIFEDNGYSIITAENGKMGLEIIESKKPDLILCDMHMPCVGGIEVVKEVKKKYSNIPIIIISGAGIEKDAIEAVEEGACNYLLKPFNSVTLLRAVDKYLKK